MTGVQTCALPISTVHEVETHWGAGSVQLQSTLQGFGLGFPAPLNKPAETLRPLRAEVTIDFPVDDATPVPPGMKRETNRPLGVLLRTQFGRDSAAFEWRGHEDEFPLTRGIVHFGPAPALLREGPGIWVDGRLPDYDLSAWLRVRLKEKPGSALAGLLAGSQLQVDHFSIFGFHLQLTARQQAVSCRWTTSPFSGSAFQTCPLRWEHARMRGASRWRVPQRAAPLSCRTI